MKTDLPDGLASPARRALAGANIETLRDLTAMRETDLKALHGMGPKAIELLRAALIERGWSFLDEKE